MKIPNRFRYINANSKIRIVKITTADGRYKYAIQKRVFYFFYAIAFGIVQSIARKKYQILIFDTYSQAKNWEMSFNREVIKIKKSKIIKTEKTS